jgi:hypothetical protein
MGRRQFTAKRKATFAVVIQKTLGLAWHKKTCLARASSVRVWPVHGKFRQDMAKNQMHGKVFEDQLRPGFPGSVECPQAGGAAFDFAADHDPVAGLPTSVKTTGHQTVCLADARRVFAAPTPFRLVVGQYQQEIGAKEVTTIHEFVIQAEEWQRLKGDLPAAAVDGFHNHLLTFKRGEHADARAWAQTHKRALATAHPGVIQLNPKIDSQSQRRLQASISLAALIEGVAEHTCHQSEYRGVALPMVLPSSLRERRRKTLVAPADAEEDLEKTSVTIRDAQTLT